MIDLADNLHVQAKGDGPLSLRRGGLWVPLGGFRTPALVQKAQHASGATTSRTPTLASTPTLGNLLLLVACIRASNAIEDVTVPAGWDLVATTSASTNNNARVAVWSKMAGAAESTSATVTIANSTGLLAGLLEYSGVTDEADVQFPSDSGASTGTTRTFGPSAEMAQSHELGIAVAMLNSTSGGWAAWGGGFTSQLSDASTGNIADAVLTSAASLSPVATWTTARINAGLLVTFRAKGKG